MNAYHRIKKAMLVAERDALAFIKSEGIYNPTIPGQRMRRAIERLEAKGLVRWSKSRHGYYVIRKRG